MPIKSEYWKDPERYRAYTRSYALKHPDEHRSGNREYMRRKRARLGKQTVAERARSYKEKDPIGHLLTVARNRAAKNGIPFDISKKDLVMPEVCPVLGLRFEWGIGKMGWRNMRSPSLDRIRPQLGYVQGNVRVISVRANHLKANGTISEIEAVLAYMKREGANLTLEEQEKVGWS